MRKKDSEKIVKKNCHLFMLLALLRRDEKDETTAILSCEIFNKPVSDESILGFIYAIARIMKEMDPKLEWLKIPQSGVRVKLLDMSMHIPGSHCGGKFDFFSTN